MCVFFGKIISYIDLETHYDEKNPEKRKKLDNKFFVPLSSYPKKFVKEIYSLIFGSSNQYSIVHSHFADYIWSFQSLLETLSNDATITDPAENHLKRTLELMQIMFDMWEETNYALIVSGFSSIKGAIDANVLKSFCHYLTFK